MSWKFPGKAWQEVGVKPHHHTGVMPPPLGLRPAQTAHTHEATQVQVSLTLLPMCLPKPLKHGAQQQAFIQLSTFCWSPAHLHQDTNPS